MPTHRLSRADGIIAAVIGGGCLALAALGLIPHHDATRPTSVSHAVPESTPGFDVQAFTPPPERFCGREPGDVLEPEPGSSPSAVPVQPDPVQRSPAAPGPIPPPAAPAPSPSPTRTLHATTDCSPPSAEGGVLCVTTCGG